MCIFTSIEAKHTYLDNLNRFDNTPYVRSFTNGTIGNFTIGAIGCHWLPLVPLTV